MGDELRIRLLGPVSVETGRRTVVVRSRPQRIVLACLALDANRVVSTTTLLDALWNGEPPTNAVAYYVEWGSRMALIYSGSNPPPVLDAPMPRWGWNQTPPWTG